MADNGILQINDILKEKSPLLVKHAKRNKCYMKLVNNIFMYFKRHNINYVLKLNDSNNYYSNLFRWSDTSEGSAFWEKLNVDYNSKLREI